MPDAGGTITGFTGDDESERSVKANQDSSLVPSLLPEEKPAKLAQLWAPLIRTSFGL